MDTKSEQVILIGTPPEWKLSQNEMTEFLNRDIKKWRLGNYNAFVLENLKSGDKTYALYNGNTPVYANQNVEEMDAELQRMRLCKRFGITKKRKTETKAHF